MRSIDFDTIISLAKGTEYSKVENGKIFFSRFSKTERNSLTYGKNISLTSAGIRLEFETDSKNLFIKTSIKDTDSHGRNFYSFDIYCNGKILGQIKNFNKEPIYPYKKYNLFERHKSFILPDGLKKITIYFPWSVQGAVKEIKTDDNAVLKPVIKKRKLIFFGDSITEGYDSLFPSLSYSSQISDLLNAEGINKGIGGSCFMPELVSNGKIRADFIIVAYGTNDWKASDFNSFCKRCDEFFKNLSLKFPDTKIFAVSPIWRGDLYIDNKKTEKFFEIPDYIEKTVFQYKNMIFINGFDFIPAKEIYFRDKYLHPNDKGFDLYKKALIKNITEELK